MVAFTEKARELTYELADPDDRNGFELDVLDLVDRYFGREAEFRRVRYRG